MPEPRPRRRWLTYSLRSLLVLLTVLAIILGLWANRAHQQRIAVATIEAHSQVNRVEYDFQRDQARQGGLSGYLATGGSRMSGTLGIRAQGQISVAGSGGAGGTGSSGGGGSAGTTGGGGGGVALSSSADKEPPSRVPEWIRKALGRDYFYDVDSVVFGRQFDRSVPQPTPDDDRAVWRALTGLWNLKQVTSYIDALDEDVAQLARLRYVTSVDLLNTPQPTDAGLRSLGSMSQLEALTIAGGEYTTVGIAHIAALQHLTRLGLLSWNNGGQSRRPIERWLGEDLAVDITDEQLRLLAGLTELEQLRFASTQVTDEGLAHLASLKKLKMLEVGAANITVAGLAPLASLPDLKSLEIYCPNLTDEDDWDIRELLPNCRVFVIKKK